MRFRKIDPVRTHSVHFVKPLAFDECNRLVAIVTHARLQSGGAAGVRLLQDAMEQGGSDALPRPPRQHGEIQAIPRRAHFPQCSVSHALFALRFHREIPARAVLWRTELTRGKPRGMARLLTIFGKNLAADPELAPSSCSVHGRSRQFTSTVRARARH